MKTLPQIQQKITKILKAEKGLPAGEAGLDFIAVLLKKFPKARVYLVGGMTRDLFLGRESKDYDFVVCGVPAKKLETVLKKLGATNLVGKRFGVFKFRPALPPPLGLPLGQGENAVEIDIALPRTEHAWGTGGYRDVETQSDWRLPIEKDLARRDFTINAMALKLGIRNKELGIMNLTDPFGGLNDLKNRLIRTVGRPEERFKEDYSRMLRGLRFACQLNFDIEEKTWSVLAKMMKKINTTRKQKLETRNKKTKFPVSNFQFQERLVPYEVISKEFLKSLVADSIKTLELWGKAGALKQLLPELLKMKGCPQPPEFHAEGDVWTHTRLALKNLNTAGFKRFVRSLPPSFQKEPLVSPTLVLAILFHDLGKPYTIKTPEKDGVDRIRTSEHDSVGAALAKKIGERLRLNSVPDLHCNLDHLAWLIQHHLLTVHGDPMKFTNRTIEKYFFNPLLPGGDLLKLIYCDQMSSFVGGKPQLGSLPRLVKRIKLLIESLRRSPHQTTALPPPLLDGREIMEILKLKPGRIVGDFKDRLREAQLAGKVKNKKEAIKYLKTRNKN